VHLLLRAFTDELARCGMRAACSSPGSRSTPIVLALAREQRLETLPHIDERSAAFFALGHAKATGRPAALACTSGTAAAHYLPAVIEASEARVPMLVLTADRPPELREVGAGQTIDQVKLFGGAAKWFFDVGTHDETPERLRWIRTLACRAYWTSVTGRPGPVHLNFALREPLVPPDDLALDLADASGRPDGRPFVTRIAPTAQLAPDAIGPVAAVVAQAQRGIIVAGREEHAADLPAAVAAFAEAAGYPVLADPLSGARAGDAAIAHYDALLRTQGFADTKRPDLVIRVGDLPTSASLRRWLASLDATQVAIDPDGIWHDPDGVVGLSLGLDPATTLGALANQAQPPGDDAWLQSWREADATAATAIATTLGDELSEPRVAAALGAALPAEATLVVAASMPVRDVETFWPVRPDPPRTLANRGANGIDGTLATAYGAAAARLGPVVALLGDVAFAHDIGGLLAGARLGVPLTIVLVDNGGGGIFDFLTVSTQTDVYERHVATPPELDAEHAAALAGASYIAVASVAELHAGLEQASGTTILHVRTDRGDNVTLHRQVWRAVAEALGDERLS